MSKIHTHIKLWTILFIRNLFGVTGRKRNRFEVAVEWIRWSVKFTIHSFSAVPIFSWYLFNANYFVLIFATYLLINIKLTKFTKFLKSLIKPRVNSEKLLYLRPNKTSLILKTGLTTLRTLTVLILLLLFIFNTPCRAPGLSLPAWTLQTLDYEFHW